MRRALALLCLVLAAGSVHADFRVLSAAPQLSNRVLYLNTRLDLTLNPKTEEALHKGVPLEVVIDVQLVRHRWWWTNHVITDWVLRRRLQFHALSRQYLVIEMRPGGSAESFVSLDQALAHLGDLSEVSIPLTARKQIDPDARHLVALRARLDIEALPALMRPLAYVTPSWRLNTGWNEWTVQP